MADPAAVRESADVADVIKWVPSDGKTMTQMELGWFPSYLRHLVFSSVTSADWYDGAGRRFMNPQMTQM